MSYQQQGDVILRACERPTGQLREQSHKTLAQGETTGHAHVVIGDGTLYLDKKGNLYLEARAPVEVVHEEHRAQTVPAGWHQIVRVQEYDHFAEEARAVQD